MKKFTKLLCVFMSMMIVLSFIVACSNNNSASPTTIIDDAYVRTIDVEQLSNQQVVNAMIQKFNDYETSYNCTSVEFSGDMFASVGEILGCDSLAYHDDTVTKKISTRLDYENCLFYMCVSYFSDDIMLETVETEVQPLYDEERDDGYIEYENKRYYVSETLNTDSLNECVAGVDDAIVIGGGAVLVAGLLITIVATPPEVHEKIIKSVKTIVETVVQAVKSFWGWFTRWIKKTFTRTRTETVTTVVVEKTPTLTISNVQYKTKAITRDERRKLPKTTYYLAFADTTNNTFYISLNPIKYAEAVGIMATPTAQNCIGNSKFMMITSVYTIFEENAFSVMDRVGYHKDTPKYRPGMKYEKILGVKYETFHYHSKPTKVIPTKEHPEGDERCPHMFFDVRAGDLL